MSTLPLCASCGVNPVGYRGRAACFVCKPKFIRCVSCGINRVGYPGRSQCYECKPKYGSWPTPSCRRCGADTFYYAAGLCRRCHRCAVWIDSCRDCLAWGVTRAEKWLCQGCRGWRARLSVGVCPACGREVALNERGYCRLCSRQANLVRPKHHSIDVVEANRHGQQLFIADLFRAKRPDPIAPVRTRIAWPYGFPVAHRQLVLFEARRDLAAGYAQALAEPPIPHLARALDDAVAQHAQQYGWSRAMEDFTRRSIRVLLAAQDTPGAPIKASDAAALRTLPNLVVRPALEVLANVGMLEDDRPPPMQAWFARRTADLPEPMRSEVETWFLLLRDGSTSTPRLRPRHPVTVRGLLHHALPALRSWNEAGVRSLREISKQDVLNVLPTDPALRPKTTQSLKSIFRVLKARRVVFTNPAARLRTGQATSTQPLPMNTAIIREALQSPNPACAAIAALVAFHGLRTGQISLLKLTDVRDGRLRLPDRDLPLAAPVRQRLAAWLDERARRWPGTRNPHLFVSQRTAVRTTPVSDTWISQDLAVPVQAIREDRILHEALVTGGDVRRLCDLFGLTVGGAERYVHTTDQPDTANHAFGSRTRVHT